MSLLEPGPAEPRYPKRLSLLIELRLQHAPSVSPPLLCPKPSATLKTRLPSKGKRVQFNLV